MRAGAWNEAGMCLEWGGHVPGMRRACAWNEAGKCLEWGRHVPGMRWARAWNEVGMLPGMRRERPWRAGMCLQRRGCACKGGDVPAKADTCLERQEYAWKCRNCLERRQCAWKGGLCLERPVPRGRRLERGGAERARKRRQVATTRFTPSRYRPQHRRRVGLKRRTST